MDFLKYIPLIFQLIEHATALRTAIRNGDSIVDVLKEKAPALIDLITQIGKQFFPNLSAPADQAQAGALALDTQAVMTIQAAMNKLGASPALIADGAYGAKTKAAVTAFQQKHGLDADGWAGKMTMAKVQEELAKL